MVGHNAPLTPPLTESDVQQSLATQAGPSTDTPNSLGNASHTLYHDAFPTISNFAVQNRLSDLIDLAETTEITADTQSRVDQSRLQVVAPLVLSYIITDDLPPARVALGRLPENLAAHALTRSLLQLLAATQYINHPLTYKSADELLEIVQGNFFSTPLAAIVKLLVERLMHAFRRKTAMLLSKAYVSLPAKLAGTYFNVSEDEARRSFESFGWIFDSTTNQLSPPPTRKSSSDIRTASSLSTMRVMIGGAAQMESGL